MQRQPGCAQRDPTFLLQFDVLFVVGPVQELHRLSKSEGLDVEVERLSAGSHQKGFAGSYAKSALGFVRLAHPNVTFLKYEDIVRHAGSKSPAACAMMGQWCVIR